MEMSRREFLGGAVATLAIPWAPKRPPVETMIVTVCYPRPNARDVEVWVSGRRLDPREIQVDPAGGHLGIRVPIPRGGTETFMTITFCGRRHDGDLECEEVHYRVWRSTYGTIVKALQSISWTGQSRCHLRWNDLREDS